MKSPAKASSARSLPPSLSVCPLPPVTVTPRDSRRVGRALCVFPLPLLHSVHSTTFLGGRGVLIINWCDARQLGGQGGDGVCVWWWWGGRRHKMDRLHNSPALSHPLSLFHTHKPYTPSVPPRPPTHTLSHTHMSTTMGPD